MSKETPTPEIVNLNRDPEMEIWSNPEHETDRLVLYFPGLPGTTMAEFGDFSKVWVSEEKGLEVWAVPHSGLIKASGETVNGKREVGVADWIEDAKSAILKAKERNCSLTILGHSFGALFAYHALAELVEEEKLPRFREAGQAPVQFIAVSAPLYDLGSLPDKLPLLGTDTTPPFTFFRNPACNEAMSEGDPRVPMASKYVFFETIWNYLSGANLMAVSPDREGFNRKLVDLFDFSKAADILRQTDYAIVTLFLNQDRWISKKAGRDLQRRMGEKSILVESVDIQEAFSSSMVSENAHDNVNQWMPIVKKYLYKL